MSINVWHNSTTNEYHVNNNGHRKSFKSFLEAKAHIDRLLSVMNVQAICSNQQDNAGKALV